MMNRTGLKALDPLNFAYVMATGGISIIFQMAGWQKLSLILFILAVISYISLLLLFGARFIFFRKRFKKESVTAHDLFEYLTFGAGTNTLALRSILGGYEGAAIVLTLIGTISIIFLIYLIFSFLLFREKVVLESITPVWLLMGIACHTVGMALTALWGQGIIVHEFFLLFAFCSWSFGVVLYLIFMTLNLYRMFFLPFVGRDLFPAYWTCMGAAAIAVVDGCKLTLVENAPLFLERLTPYIQGSASLLWGWATAWIPILCLMEAWKYGYFKMPFNYHPSLWTMVFPLAMYTAATDLLATSLRLELVRGMVPFCIWISFGCWLLICSLIGMNFRKIERG